MDELKFADVAVDAPVDHSRTFTYRIPFRLSVQPGQLVWVPFGSQILQGIVVELSPSEPEFPTRDILQAVEPAPLLSPELLRLGQWLSRYYRSPLFAALSLMLPPGFESRVRSRVFPVEGAAPDPQTMREETAAALEALSSGGGMSQADFVKLSGRRGTRDLNRLVEQGAVRREVTIPRPRVVPKYEAYLIPATPRTDPSPKLTSRQQALLDAVRQPPGHLPLSEANREFGRGAAQALWNKGLVAYDWWRISGGPPPVLRMGDSGGPDRLTLTTEQSLALSEITASLDAAFSRNHPTARQGSAGRDPATEASSPSRSFLLHGVTGSGKTEVYLRAIDHAVRLGRRALFLVPEIALTPQTLERVDAWFAGRVSLLHSKQTPRQKFDQWWDIRGSNYDVVVGPRSALFAPLDNLGIIVLDEEHEWTYKQEESHPLYHARTAALELARTTGAIVVLGSATPSIESYYHASRGRLRLLSMPHRVTGVAMPRQVGNQGIGETRDRYESGSSPGLAHVEVCDMRQELREGNRHIFSRSLTKGTAGVPRQRQSGHPVPEPPWFLPHSPVPRLRARCRLPSLRHFTDLPRRPAPVALPPVQLFPAPADRMPRVPGASNSAAWSRYRAGRIRGLGAFPRRPGGQAGFRRCPCRRGCRRGGGPPGIGRNAGVDRHPDGCQGLDVPNVALVGVVLADIGLNVPDFRSGERVFSLLCQVAGRAGRGGAPGRVFIQTYDPDHYAIHAGANQSYSELYHEEIEFRRRFGYPPFNQLAHIIYQNTDPEACQRQAAAIAEELKRRAASEGRSDIEVGGPAPGLPPRLRGRHRWRMLLRGRNLAEFLDGTDFPVGCTIDIDPANVT